MKRSLEMPVAKNARRGRTYGRDRIYRTPVGSAGCPKTLGLTYFIYLFIIFISSWYKIVKSTNKNQPSTRYNYSFHATVHTKENVRPDIISSTVKTTACIYWIPIHTIQLKFYYK